MISSIPIANGVPSPGATRAETSAHQIFLGELDRGYRRCDQTMAYLSAVQWLAAIALAVWLSPRTWIGTVSSTHPHVYLALCGGGLLALPILVLVRYRPGSALTRHAAAFAQMMWSALLIHVSGGRIETHFHIFGSLAFLAFYCDWKVILTATLTVAADHLVRGIFMPESVYGIVNPEWWRFLEHAFWVIFEDVILVMGILQSVRQTKVLSARQSEAEFLRVSVEHKVVERTSELAASREQFRALLETTRMVPWEMDESLAGITYAGPQGAELLGCSAEAWLAPDFWSTHLHPDDVENTRRVFQCSLDDRAEHDVEFRLRHEQGRWVWVRCMLRGVVDAGQLRLRGVLVDITRQRELEVELQHAQKLESVGRLASGVAHEINTPIQFVGDSVQFVREAFTDLGGLMRRYSGFRQRAAEEPALKALAEELAEAEKAADLTYVMEQVPKALDRSIEGLGRVATLVRSMKEFAHPDQREKVPADLNRALATTLEIARNEYKYVAEIATEFGQIPEIPCHVGELNQVFLNIIVNAAHAIGDVVKGTSALGRISIATACEGSDVLIRISDTGGGVPEHIKGQIFEPFFTTKEVGRGTGQGLAIAHSVVTRKHGGTLTFETRPGDGTTFIIRLPMHPEGEEREEAAA